MASSFPFLLPDCICITLLMSVVAAGLAGNRLQALFCAIMFLIGGALVVEAGFGWQIGAVWHTNAPLGFGFFPIRFHLDSVAAVFIALFGVEIIAVSLFSRGYLASIQARINLRHYWAAMFLFILGIVLTVLSADAVSFMVFWELMSLSSAALVACEHKQHQVQQAAMIYMGATRTATAFLAGGFLWMHSISHSWLFSDWSFATPAAWWPAALILIGFAIKAGSWPFHLWVPYTYPAAPATASALISGAMSKVAVYGMIRLLVVGGLNCAPAIYVLLFLGTVSSFWGVLFGLIFSDIKKLLAYSSVENTGLICIAIAVAMHSHMHGLTDIAGVATAAAMLHAVNHGVFKSLLFLSAGAVEVQARTRDLNLLGGLGKRMPVTMLSFLIAGASICALPPLNGFGSKWLIYQSLLRTTFESSSLIDRSIAFVVIGVLALVGGLSLALFTKTIGVVFLGNPRSKNAGNAVEVRRDMQLSQLGLAALCVGLGVMLTFALRLLARPVATAYGATAAAALSGYVYMPIGFVGASLLTLGMVIYFVFLKSSKVREYITWECGYGDLSSRTQVSPESFSQPIASIFSPLLRYKLATQIRGKDHRHFPEHISIEAQMVSVLESRVYRPALEVLEACAKLIAKVQAGSIHLYLLYVCLTLVLLLFVGTRL
jgi:formate hydrogenlyase subunit 3/multisubunit Na+/H+ antiporter MnhD subunit